MEVTKNTKFFVGYELEGKYQGIYTLFITGDQNIEDIEDILKKNQKIKHIYFGANNQSRVNNLEIIKKISSMCKYLITYEFLVTDNVPIEILNNCNIHKMMTIKKDNYPVSNLTLKLETNKGIFCYNEYLYNNFENYKNDRVIL